MSIPRQSIRRSGATLAAAVAVIGLLAGCAQQNANDGAAGKGTTEDTKAGITEAKARRRDLGQGSHRVPRRAGPLQDP